MPTTTLPFQKIRQIEQMLDQVQLDDIVLVFSQNDMKDQRCLLVYNTTSLPLMPNSDWNAKCLNDLKPDDYTRFDGPVVGFSALDVAFPDIPTHGVNFYHLQHIFDSKNKQTQYQDTAYRLAKWLWANHTKFANPQEMLRRGQSKIVELALPKLLLGRNIEHLIAVLPHDDLGEYLSGQSDSFRTIFLEHMDDALGQIDPEYWIVAMEEIFLFNPELGRHQPHFIDLRFILRQAGRTNELQQACFALARRCWQEWLDSQNPNFKKAAYALSTEAWLMQEDAEDLIALLPHQDFEHFIQTGDAIRVYRSPRVFVRAADSQRLDFSLVELVTGQIMDERFDDYRTTPVSFHILSAVFERITPEHTLDLGMVLYKVGKEFQLAQTLWLFSRDLFIYQDVSQAIAPESAVITDLAWRSALIYGLSEPWHKQWHTRYEKMVEGSYNHLLICLLNQEKSANLTDKILVEYYRALQEWYGCYASLDIPHSLNAALRAAQNFLNESEKRTDLQPERAIAKQMVKIVKGLTDYDTSPQQRNTSLLPSHFEVMENLRNVADPQTPIEIFSEPFDGLLSIYQSCHAQWQSMQANLSTERPTDEHLRKLLDDYALLQRIGYAPAHERRVLDWACNQDRKRIGHLRNALGLGPMIQVRVLNPQVILKKHERLHVEVENIGGAVAHNFEVTLSPSQRFEFLSPPDPMKRDTLDVRHSYRLTYDIRPLDPLLELHFAYRFQTHDDQLHSGEEYFELNAIQSRSSGLVLRGGNPYQAGVPVAGDQFFGRKNELNEVLNLLLGGVSQPVLLRGPRRIGKSSILHQLERLLTQEGELQRRDFSVESEFALRRIYPVLTSLQEIPNIRFVSNWFLEIYKKICDTIGVGYPKQNLDEEFNRSPYHAFARFMNRLFEQRSGIRLLMMIDEWDEQRHLPELGPSLRAIMQNEPRVNWIVSSTWTLKAETGRFGSPFYGQTKSIELKEIDWSSASKLILEPSAKIGVDWHGDAIVTLLEQTARRPFLIQFLCQEVIDYLYNQPSMLVEIESETVNIAISEFIKSPQTSGQPFSFLWENGAPTRRGQDEVRLHWLGRLVLWALDMHAPASLTRPEIKDLIQSTLRQRKLEIPEDFFEEEFDEQMTELEYIFDAITMLDGQRYRFSVPLAQQWFHHMIARYSDPAQYVYMGIIQDYEEWKQTQAKEKKNG